MEYKAIKPSELRVGDIITAQWVPPEGDHPSELFTEVVVTKLEPNQVWAGFLGFLTYCNTFYLIERPKKSLPTKIGSVVEADGQTWVLCDPEDDYTPWRSTPDGFWASAEDLAEYDFTVV